MIRICKKQENKPVEDVDVKNGGNTNKSRKSRRDHHELDPFFWIQHTEKH